MRLQGRLEPCPRQRIVTSESGPSGVLAPRKATPRESGRVRSSFSQLRQRRTDSSRSREERTPAGQEARGRLVMRTRSFRLCALSSTTTLGWLFQSACRSNCCTEACCARESAGAKGKFCGEPEVVKQMTSRQISGALRGSAARPSGSQQTPSAWQAQIARDVALSERR